MAAMWVFLANTSHSGKVIESSKEFMSVAISIAFGHTSD
jgi:hypothetical protein